MPRTSQTSTSRAVTDAAAAWFAKREAGRFSEADGEALERWLQADPAHKAAWLKLDRLWSGLESTPAAERTAAREHVANWQAKRKRRRSRMALAGGTTLCLALVLMSNLPLRLRADAMTGTGEGRSVTLADGSGVRLDTDTAIAVDYSAGRRTVRLLKGAAEFRVEPDTARPFVVEAGGGTATALGTRYIVRMLDDGARVTVTQHSVAIRPSLALPAITIREGESIDYGRGRTSRPIAVDSHEASGWVRGQLIFRNRPLGDVVAEIARYHSGIIRVMDENVAARPISGVFPTNDPVGAIASLETSFGLHSWRLTDRLILITK